MKKSEYLTARFYQWEYRGRGWLLGETPVDLEPPFIPFVRYAPNPRIDDGKHPTIISKAVAFLKGSQSIPAIDEFELDYEHIEPFEYDNDSEATALQVKFPKDRRISADSMKALLTLLSYARYPISFEIIGNDIEIIVQFVCSEVDVPIVTTYIKSFFPKCTVIKEEKYIVDILLSDKASFVTDFGLKEECIRPLPTSKSFNFDSLTAFFGVLETLTEGQQAGMQILFKATVNAWTESMINSVTLPGGTSFFADAPESPKLAIEKTNSPLFAVTIRTFGQADTLAESQEVFEAITYPLLKAAEGTYNALIPLPTPEYDVETRMADIYMRESHRLGMLLNVDELMHLLHFPSESIQSKKLFASARKTKDTPSIALDKEYCIGINPHNNAQEPVTTGIDERLKHTHIIGATGTGKSTLIANLILQDIEKGLGLALIDPHGDLVQDVMARIPAHRVQDVVLIDPSDGEYPVGLNLLEAHNDIEKEILSSDLVASFRRLSTSWGDQMNAVFGNAILAILESSKGGTLHDLRRFLLEKDYREKYLAHIQDPSVLYYWLKEFPILKSNSVGPILTRLDSFLRPRTIRNMIVQQSGLDFEQLLNSNKIILIKLSQGLIGTENSYLLGSLILSKIHQAAFARQNQATRNPFFIYIDEFQNIVTPSIREMLSGVRKYNVGLILSHQDLQQLHKEDGELLNSVLSNSYTRVAFRIGEPDAKKLENGFDSFDNNDLQNLGRGEALVRIEQPQYDCSVNTIPLPPLDESTVEAKRIAIISHSRKTYASTRTEVEAQLLATLSVELRQQEKAKTKPPKEEKVTPEKREQQPVQETIPEPVVYDVLVIDPPLENDIQPESTEAIEEATKPTSTHKYLQALVKRMAEARGYTATIEAQIPSGDGNVDVLLSKNGTTIAVEICITTDSNWEMHNISKCISAGYTTVVSLSGDNKQLDRIKKQCSTGIAEFERKDVHFFTPDVFFQYLDRQAVQDTSTQSSIKGYRVNVSYDPISQEEMNRKRASVAQVVMNSMKRNQKKK